ncbi:hypothetical protein [Sphaerisporangium sp. NPDC051011]|uniref:hypothetical protein n=1 Tax=Sphaerisporangium sp. NPDC051011 TaxID=3155792 RepID=UPI0033D914C5
MAPYPDTSWHPQLPPLVASGLTIPQAALRLHVSTATIWKHVRKYPHLRAAVDMARLEATHPGIPRLTWYLERSGSVLAVPVSKDPARQAAAVRQWAEALGLPVEARAGGLSVEVVRDGARVRVSTSVRVISGAGASSRGDAHAPGG